MIVLIHGLLMNRHMYDHLAPEMAARGIRVITVDLLGHGDSDSPHDMRAYNMTAFADQLAALIDHLELDRPVVGGTSLGANVALELASAPPGARHAALFIEMPVLDNALVAAGLIFTADPARAPGRRAGPAAASPRSPTGSRAATSSLDILLDWTRRDPEASEAVLEGILFGRTAPPRDERERDRAAGAGDRPPGRSAASLLATRTCWPRSCRNARLVDAKSILEWRVKPGRLDDELADFLDEVCAGRAAAEPAGRLRQQFSEAAPLASRARWHPKEERERRRHERLAAEQREAGGRAPAAAARLHRRRAC